MNALFVRKHALLGVRLFTAGLFLVFLLFFLWKYQRGFYTDPVLDLRVPDPCLLAPGLPASAGASAEGCAADPHGADDPDSCFSHI